MKANWETIRPYLKFRYLLLGVFLFFSCYLLVHYFTGLVSNPKVQTGAAIFVIVLDIAMQIVILARAKQLWNVGAWKKGKWKNRIIALILFTLYAVYLIFYAILSAVGFFMVEVQKTETEIVEIQETRTNNQSRIETIDGELKALNIQLATEGRTGYGGKSQVIIERKRELESERKELEAESNKSLTVKQESVKSAVNSFEILSKNLGVNRNNLETLVFGIAVIMLYVFIIMLTEKDIGKTIDNTVPNPPVTINKTQPDPPVSPDPPKDDMGESGIETKEDKLSEAPQAPTKTDNDKFLLFVDELYRGIDDSKLGTPECISVNLNSFVAVKKAVRGKIGSKAFVRFKNKLRDIGAITTDNGQLSLGHWKREQIHDWIRGNSS